MVGLLRMMLEDLHATLIVDTDNRHLAAIDEHLHVIAHALIEVFGHQMNAHILLAEQQQLHTVMDI
jgi:hypothetical protein